MLWLVVLIALIAVKTAVVWTLSVRRDRRGAAL